MPTSTDREPLITVIGIGADGWTSVPEASWRRLLTADVILGGARHLALDLFDAFGSKEKTLHANMGGHTGVPQFEGDDGTRFFARHLSWSPG